MDRNEKGQFFKGMIPWNKGRKLWYAGHTKPHTKKSRILISKKRKGKGTGKDHWTKNLPAELVEKALNKIGMKNRAHYLGKKLPQKHRENIMKAMQKYRGEKNPSWRGGKVVRNKYIYIICPKRFRSMARKDGYVLEHRIVMARHLRRALKRQEVVDHINRDTMDNRIENLKYYPSNAKHLKETLNKNSSHSPWYALVPMKNNK